MTARAVGKILQLVSGYDHRLNCRRRAGWNEREVPVTGSELGMFAGPEQHRCRALAHECGVSAFGPPSFPCFGLRERR